MAIQSHLTSAEYRQVDKSGYELNVAPESSNTVLCETAVEKRGQVLPIMLPLLDIEFTDQLSHR